MVRLDVFENCDPHPPSQKNRSTSTEPESTLDCMRKADQQKGMHTLQSLWTVPEAGPGCSLLRNHCQVFTGLGKEGETSKVHTGFTWAGCVHLPPVGVVEEGQRLIRLHQSSAESHCTVWDQRLAHMDAQLDPVGNHLHLPLLLGF